MAVFSASREKWRDGKALSCRIFALPWLTSRQAETNPPNLHRPALRTCSVIGLTRALVSVFSRIDRPVVLIP